MTTDRHATQLIVFDWDGTLVNSIPRIVAAMQAAAQALGYPVPATDRIHSIIGLALDVAIQRLFPETEAAEQARIIGAYRQQYTDTCPIPERLFPETPRVLEALKTHGYRLGIATGKGRPGLERSLARNGLQAQDFVIRCADETRSKPDPAMLAAIRAQTSIARDSTLLVGDSVHDAEMAHRDGTRFIAVTTGTASAATLSQWGPILTLDRLDGLLEHRSAWDPGL